MYSMWQTELRRKVSNIIDMTLGRFCTVSRMGLSACPVTCMTNRNLRFWRARRHGDRFGRSSVCSRRALRISR